MNQEGKFWIAFTALIVLLTAVIATAMTYNEVSKRNAITDMVRAGATPAEAACAIESYPTTVCVVAAGTKP